MLEPSFNVERLLKEAERLGATEAEITLEESSSKEVQAKNNIIERAVTTRLTRLGVRVAIGKRTGAAGGDVASLNDALTIIERALKIARTSREDPEWPGLNPRIEKAPAKIDTYDVETAQVTPGKLVELLNEEIHHIREKPGVIVATASLSAGESMQIIVNSYGGPVEEASTGFRFWIELKSSREGKEGTYYEYGAKAKLDPQYFQELSLSASERVLDAAKAVPVGDLTDAIIVLEAREAASILETLVTPAISAYNVQLGRSPLKGKLGEQVLSPDITVVDDPFLPWETGSALFDDEGHPTIRKEVFSKGILKTYLYDHYTASKEKKESTGNGFKWRPWNNPSPSPSNLIIKPKKIETLDKAVKEIRKGLIVASTIGSWLSNPISGQLNSTVTLGYLIENGEITKPVKGAVLGGDIYDILSKGYHTSIEKPRCIGGVCTPSLVLSRISIAGSQG